jgi:metal-responsive CopG/Arc/MetJ family transcriptional regulator
MAEMNVMTKMPRELAELSKSRANSEGISRSELIRRLLTDFLVQE